MELKHRIRALWRNSNSAERKLWQVLHDPRLYSKPNLKTSHLIARPVERCARQQINHFIGSHFVRHVTIGDFIVDFLCEELKLVVFLQTAKPNYSDKNIALSAKSDCAQIYERTLLLQYRGYLVVQLFYHDVLSNLQGVLDNLNIVVYQRKLQLLRDQEQFTWI